MDIVTTTIALTLSAPVFCSGVLPRVNPEGESDSIGTICGYVFGAAARLLVSRRGIRSLASQQIVVPAGAVRPIPPRV